MSVEAMSWALSVPVGGTKKVLLLGLANHAHPDGSHAFPSVERLSEYACCDRATVFRNLAKLRDEGWIIEDGKGPKGQVRYRLPLLSEGVAKCDGVAPVRPEPSTTSEVKEGEEGSGEEGADATAPPEDRPATIWDFYLSVMKKRGRKLPAPERRIIAEALKAAESLADDGEPDKERAAAKLVCLAIRGCERSDFHMKRGRYSGRDGQVHNKLSQILKGKRGGRTTSEQIEYFAEIAGKAGVGVGITSADPAKVRQEQVHVRTGLAPGATEHLRKRGKEAADWLAQHGIESVFDGRGGVRFATRSGGTS